MNCPQDWPEPIIRVQSLSVSGIPIIPDRSIKPPPDRPVTNTAANDVNIPLIELKGLFGDGSNLNATTLDQISQACLFGVSPRLMGWREHMKLYSDDPAKIMRLLTSFNMKKETLHNRRDFLRLRCYPLDQYVLEWPSNPSSFNNWPSQALGSHQDDHRKELVLGLLADNLLRMQTPISGNSTSRSQAQEGSHNSIVPYLNHAEDGSTRILPWLGNNQLTPEERHSESETTIQDHYIVDMDSISSGENFHPGTFGVPNSYPPAQVVLKLGVPSDTGTQNPTADQYWLKISKMLIPVSAGAVYNSSSMFAKVANTLAFIATLTAISLRPSRSRAIRISTKFGAIACAAGTLATVGHDLPDDYRWASGVAFLIPAIAVTVA